MKKIPTTQTAWVRRGLSDVEARRLDAKIGKLQTSAGNERFVRALKADAQFAAIYATSKEADPEKFLEKFSERIGLRNEMQDLNKNWNEEKAKEFRDEFMGHLLDVTSENFGKIESLRKIIEPGIKKNISDLNAAIQILEKNQEKNSEIIGNLKKEMEKLQALATFLSIEIPEVKEEENTLSKKLQSWLGQESESKIEIPLTFKNVLERLEIKEYGKEGSPEAALISAQKILKLENKEPLQQSEANNELKNEIDTLDALWNPFVQEYNQNLTAYKEAVNKFIDEKGTSEELKTTISTIEKLGPQLEEKFQKIRPELNKRLQKCFSDLNNVLYVLKIKQKINIEISKPDEGLNKIIKQIENDLEKIQGCAAAIGIRLLKSSEADETSYRWLRAQLRENNSITYDDILEQFQIKVIGRTEVGSLEDALLKTAREIGTITVKIEKKFGMDFDHKEIVKEGKRVTILNPDLLNRIKEQVAIIQENCTQIIIFKAITDFLGSIMNYVANLLTENKDNQK
ncbi:MAG: hypothetical protein C5B43_02585 [Verrucomicrobia bacterium]|nr:MAG: hypothetical protein C5B43_02585 [Verrucomicrobiota bacterium]